MSEYYVGIDSGTQSTKALIVRGETGDVVGRGSVPYDLIGGLAPGHCEQHPQTWVDATAGAVRSALSDSGVEPDGVLGIGVSGQQHGFVPLDSSGQVIRPAKLWCDTATVDQCNRIMRAVGGPRRCFELLGNLVLPGFTASKILWLKENEPDAFRRLRTVLLPHDYLNYWLTGETVMEWGDASGTALMNVRSRQWSPDVVKAIDGELPDKLPPLRDSAEPCGRLTGEAAAALGLRAGVLVAAGGGDNMMAAIGTGNVTAGVVTASLGTSGTIFACCEQPVVDDQGEIAGFCDSTGRWLPLLCTMNVTIATELTKQLFGLDTDGLNELAAGVRPGCDGLLLVPYFSGERCPNVPDGTGVWFGANRITHTPAHFCRAAMEGAVLGMNYGLRRMRALGIEPREIRLTGGGARSRLWRQIVGDVFGTPVVCTVEPEGAAFGAAAQACWAVRREADRSASIADVTSAWVRLDQYTRSEPDAEASAVYASMQALQDRVSLQLRSAFALR
jgi:xylulokinase